MSGPAPAPDPREPSLADVVFRTAAAPGLEEDDLFAALHGLPGTGVFWGEGVPRPAVADEPWDEERERRRRHDDVLRRWRPPAAGGPS